MLILKKETGELFYNSLRLGRLNVSESNIFIYLYQYKDALISRDHLLEIGWPKRVVTPNSLNMAIKNIRYCLEKANLDDVIITHIKKGFTWNASYLLEIIEVTPQDLQVQESFSQIEKQPECTTEHIEPSKIYIQETDCQIKDELYVKTSTKSCMQQPIAHHYIKKSMLLIGVIFLAIISIAIVMFYNVYWTRVGCYSVNDAKLCGVGQFKREVIPLTLASGNYWYGYRISDGEFYYVKD